MNKIQEIFNAWRIAFNPNLEQADLAAKRIEICDACEFKQGIPVGPGIEVYRCKVCGCALKGKIFTEHTYLNKGGSCPKEKWKNVEQEWLDKNKKII